MDLEITVTADIRKQVEVTVHLEDVIDKMNSLGIAHRWNYISKILNAVNTEDIECLTEGQKQLVSNYLLQQSKRYSSGSTDL
jgi:hypothetical protein